MQQMRTSVHVQVRASEFWSPIFSLKSDLNSRAWEQVAAGMEAVAAAAVVHRGLAAHNVLLSSTSPPHARVAGFSLAVNGSTAASAGLDRSELKPPAEGARWSAPEALEGGCWTEASDVWSWGVLLWEVRGTEGVRGVVGDPCYSLVRFCDFVPEHGQICECGGEGVETRPSEKNRALVLRGEGLRVRP